MYYWANQSGMAAASARPVRKASNAPEIRAVTALINQDPPDFGAVRAFIDAHPALDITTTYEPDRANRRFVSRSVLGQIIARAASDPADDDAEDDADDDIDDAIDLLRHVFQTRKGSDTASNDPPLTFVALNVTRENDTRLFKFLLTETNITPFDKEITTRGYEQSLLDAAVEMGQINAVQTIRDVYKNRPGKLVRLVQHVNKRTGQTPFGSASTIDMFKLLQSFDPHTAFSPKYKKTQSIIAAAQKPDTADLLVYMVEEAGIGVDTVVRSHLGRSRQPAGSTALNVACKYKQHLNAHALVDLGANINAHVWPDVRPPLISAHERNLMHRILAAPGFDAGTVTTWITKSGKQADPLGRRVAEKFADSAASVEILKRLIGIGIDVTDLGVVHSVRSVVTIAASLKKRMITMALVRFGGASATDALHEATKHSVFTCDDIKELIRRGAVYSEIAVDTTGAVLMEPRCVALSHRNRYGNKIYCAHKKDTALHGIAFRQMLCDGDADIVKALTDGPLGIPVDYPGFLSFSPLRAVCRVGRSENKHVVKALLDAGASPDGIADSKLDCHEWDTSLLQYTIASPTETGGEIAQMLLDAGATFDPPRRPTGLISTPALRLMQKLYDYQESPWTWIATPAQRDMHRSHAIAFPGSVRHTDALLGFVEGLIAIGERRGGHIPPLPLEMWVMIFEYLTKKEIWDVVQTVFPRRRSIPLSANITKLMLNPPQGQ